MSPPAENRRIAVAFYLVAAYFFVAIIAALQSPIDSSINSTALMITRDVRGVITGKVEIGQGIKTVIAQIAAEELDVTMSRMRVLLADTELSPDEGYTAGSMSTSMSGGAVRQAAAEALLGFEQKPLLIAVTVLTSMSDDDLRELGYTEPQPQDDLSGLDVARKALGERVSRSDPVHDAELSSLGRGDLLAQEVELARLRGADELRQEPAPPVVARQREPLECREHERTLGRDAQVAREGQ